MEEDECVKGWRLLVDGEESRGSRGLGGAFI
jgi:hypothetical protein